MHWSQKLDISVTITTKKVYSAAILGRAIHRETTCLSLLQKTILTCSITLHNLSNILFKCLTTVVSNYTHFKTPLTCKNRRKNETVALASVQCSFAQSNEEVNKSLLTRVRSQVEAERHTAACW